MKILSNHEMVDKSKELIAMSKAKRTRLNAYTFHAECKKFVGLTLDMLTDDDVFFANFTCLCDLIPPSERSLF